MSNHSIVVDVSLQTTYPADAQVDLRKLFVPRNYTFISQTSDGTTWFSFDGQQDHGQVRSGFSNDGVHYPTRAQRVWLRKEVGTDPTKVLVMASS